jgi:hypothetical protein
VAILNWDHALFFEFHEVSQKASKRVGDQVKFIWATEKKDFKEKHANIGNLRKVILGWHLRAFQEHFGY